MPGLSLTVCKGGLTVKKRLIFILATVLAFTLQVLPAAAETTAEELSLKQAMGKAITYSKDLRNTQMDLEISDINLDDITTSMNGVRSGYNIPEQTERDFYAGFFRADLNHRTTEKKIENLKKQIKIDVKKAYYDVLLTQDQLELAKKKLALTLVQHSHTTSKYKVGLATQLDIYTADSQLEADKVNLETKKNELIKAYAQLNKLIGNSQDAQPKLVDTIEYVPAEELDVDSEILKAVGNSYEIWSAKEAAKASENMKYYTKYYDIGEYNASQAANTLQDTKEQIRLTARNLCLTVINLEKNLEDLDGKEKQLEETVRVYSSLYQVGMKTKDELDSVQFTLADVKANKKNIQVAHINALENLQRLTGDMKSTME